MNSIVKTALILAWLMPNAQSFILKAQTVLTIDDNQLVQSGGYIVLSNTKLVNNSTLDAGTGEIIIEGDATDANSAIEGTSATTFYNLSINKSSNNAILGNEIIIGNQLTLSNGHLDLQTSNATLSSGATISGGSSSSFVKTSSTGVLVQEVGASKVVFPVGFTNYVPLTMQNNGTTDSFKVRVIDAVYQDGTSGSELTSDVLDCTWFIEEANRGGSDATLSFQWNTSDELTSFDRTQAFVSHYTGGAWSNYTTQSATGSDPYTMTQSGITSFSPFTLASNVAVLPVELLYFYAEQANENVQLDWQTATEINNSHFDVEWSTNGMDFQKIGQVQGAGTTNDIQFYEYLHTQPAVGNNYYRLKQVDFNGKFVYTRTLHIVFQAPEVLAKEYLVYPNPASDYIIVENTLAGDIIQVFSINGQFIKSLQTSGNRHRFSIEQLPRGAYFLKINDTVKRILIQ